MNPVDFSSNRSVPPRNVNQSTRPAQYKTKYQRPCHHSNESYFRHPPPENNCMQAPSYRPRTRGHFHFQQLNYSDRPKSPNFMPNQWKSPGDRKFHQRPRCPSSYNYMHSRDHCSPAPESSSRLYSSQCSQHQQFVRPPVSRDSAPSQGQSYNNFNQKHYRFSKSLNEIEKSSLKKCLFIIRGAPGSGKSTLALSLKGAFSFGKICFTRNVYIYFFLPL